MKRSICCTAVTGSKVAEPLHVYHFSDARARLRSHNREAGSDSIVSRGRLCAVIGGVFVAVSSSNRAASGAESAMFRRVLLCYDGSAASRRALQRGAELAVLVGAQVHVLSIIPSGVADPAVIAGALGHSCLVDDAREPRKLLDDSIEWLKAHGVSAEGYLASGNTIDQILSYTKKLGIDLIVLGHYPRPSGGFWWSGPQRASLAERANCCVLVAVNAPEEPRVRGP
jgi:nucleotide-binding universal stress UspA family protein